MLGMDEFDDYPFQSQLAEQVQEGGGLICTNAEAYSWLGIV